VPEPATAAAPANNTAAPAGVGEGAAASTAGPGTESVHGCHPASDVQRNPDHLLRRPSLLRKLDADDLQPAVL
jgi:hypothetical protein